LAKQSCRATDPLTDQDGATTSAIRITLYIKLVKSHVNRKGCKEPVRHTRPSEEGMNISDVRCKLSPRRRELLLRTSP
jgi:hypothetical protein